MLDLITVGGIAGIIVVVLAACYAMYKYLSRESTYEEVKYLHNILYIVMSANVFLGFSK
jgi:heme A synthase